MRRHVIVFSAATILAAAWAASARQSADNNQSQRRITPPTTGSTAIICHADEPGQRLLIVGKVVDRRGRAIDGAAVTVYNTDIDGLYVPQNAGTRSPRLRGSVITDSAGRFQVLTVVPASYPGSREPAHIHLEASAPGYRRMWSDIWFEGDPFITVGKQMEARRRATNNPDEVTRIERVELLAGGLNTVCHTIEMRED